MLTGGSPKNRLSPWRYIPGLLMLAGGLLVVLQSELPLKLLRATLGWIEFGWPPQASVATPLDEIYRYGYRLVTLQQPLLPWLLWLAGAIWLLIIARPALGRPAQNASPEIEVASSEVQAVDSLVPADLAAKTARTDAALMRTNPAAAGVARSESSVKSGFSAQSAGAAATAQEGRIRVMLAHRPGEFAAVDDSASPLTLLRGKNRIRSILLALALLAICGLGAWTRAANMLPGPDGAWPASNFDEQVYYSNARLLTQGDPPYKDHFLAHPPGSTYVFALAVAAQPAADGQGAFVAARQWLFALSLLAVPLVFLCGRRLGGDGAGLLAALIVALDGKAASVAVLETLVNVFSLLGLLLYLYRPGLLPARYKALWLLLAGCCCGWAILAKVPGLALAAALPLHALLMRRPKDALALLAGTIGGALLGVLPFLLIAPGELLRQTFFFQMLRPQEVRPGIDQAARIAAYPESLLTTALAAAGLVLLAAAIWRAGAGEARRDELDRLRTWLVVPLWSVPVLAVFVLGRSYHSPYMVQWIPPLALLGAALAAPLLWRLAAGRGLPSWLATAAVVPAVLLVLPLAAGQVRAALFVEYDNVYQPAATIVQSVTGREAEILAFDPGFAFVAGRAPVRLLDGRRLVDSAGHMTYYALGIDRRSWGDLLADALSFDKERNAPQVFQSTAAQASVLGGLWNASLAVVDGKIGLPQLRGQSVQLIEGLSSPRWQVDHVRIYALNPERAAGHDFAGMMSLRAVTLEELNASGGTNALLLPAAPPDVDAGIALPAGSVLQAGLYWQVPAEGEGGGADYRVVLRLDDAQGNKAQQTDRAPEEGAALTSAWQRQMVYPDLQNIPMPAAPGRYTLHIGLYDPNNPGAYQEWQPPVEILVR